MTVIVMNKSIRRRLVRVACQLCIAVLVFQSLFGMVEANKCSKCKSLINKFKQGMDKTAKGNFGGGNTDWETRKLGNYLTSETRFEEILENLCQNDKDVSFL